MLARIQQLVVLTLVSASACAFALGARLKWPWLGIAFVLLVVSAYLIVLAFEFWLLRSSYAADDPHRPRFGELLRAWTAEVLVAPRVFLWSQPFRSAGEPDRPRANAAGRRGIVLVHGFFCNRGVWNPWLRRLRIADIPFIAVSMEPIFGPIDDYASTIARAVRDLEVATGLAPVIVAHSMGGLAVRAWLARDRAARVHRLITIASPHAGTRAARHGRGRNVAQMRDGSDWIGELARAESLPRSTHVVCFWGRCDNIVFPTRNATLEGADNRHLEATPHVAMIFHPDVFAEAMRAVASD